MSFISAFDVMGPNMIGPSSSHTAGAARISYLAQKMIEGPLKRADFILYGSFARTYRGHGTDRALLGGIMGFSTDDMRYLTFPPLSCAHIRIQYCGDGTNYWGISEIRINEVDN